MERQQVAKTILAQLGGQRFIAMTGASSFASGIDCLTFRLPSTMTRNRIGAVRITLTPMDVYKVDFLKMRRFEVVTVAEREDVYAEDLCSVFEHETGLATSLGSAVRA